MKNHFKLFIIIGAIAMLIAPTFTNAATIEELQAQVQALLKQIQIMQSQKVEIPTEAPQNIPNFNRNLYFGMKNNPDVTDLQEFLTEQGYYAGPISGNFGLLTVQAVKKFQSANGISPTGYFGPRTRAIASAIMQKLVGQICPREEGCEGNILPVEKLVIYTNSDLRGTLGEYFGISIVVSGGSGNYSYSYEGNVPPGLDYTEKGGPGFYGTPTKRGVYNVTFFAKDVNSGAYGKERFTIVIKDKISSERPPVISGVKGPTTLKVGEEGVWSVGAGDPSNGALVYRVVWGDEVYQKEAAGPSASQRAIPFRQTATFAHTYYTSGVYSPTFYVVNDRGLEVKTIITVNVTGPTVATPSIFEQVKCVFNGSQLEQKCYTAVTDVNNIYYNRVCSGVGACVVDIKGYKGDSILWKSSCLEGYAFTTVDGQNESIDFKCGVSTTPSITVLYPNGGENWQRGSYQTIKWTATNGTMVSIALVTPDKSREVYGLTVAIPNDGNETILIPSDVPLGQHLLRVRCVENCVTGAAQTDESDAPFSIVATTTSRVDEGRNLAAALQAISQSLNDIQEKIKTLSR